VWDKGAKQRDLVDNLEKNFPLAAQRYNLPLGLLCVRDNIGARKSISYEDGIISC